MNEQSTTSPVPQPGNGMTVGASVVAAGVAGLAGALLMGRQNKTERARERVETRVAQLEVGANEAIAQLNRALEGLRFDQFGTSRKARKQTKKLAKSTSAAADEAVKAARKRVAEIDKEIRKLKVAEKANKLASDGSDRASNLSATVNDRIASLLAEARHGASDMSAKASSAASTVAGRSTDQAERARGKVEPLWNEASRLAHEARLRGADLASQGTALVSDVRHRSPELLERANRATSEVKEITPEVREKLSDIAEKVAERGGEVVSKARERAPEVAARAKDRAPEVFESVTSTLATKSHDLQEQAKPLLAEAGAAASHAADQARHLARDAGKALIPEVQHQAEALTDRVSTGTHALEHKSRRAVSAAGQGSKDAGALVMWSAAAAGVAYWALLNDEQRSKVRESGKRVWAEMREVYNDIRGYDEEFT